VYFGRNCWKAGISHYCDTSVEVPHLLWDVANKARYRALREKRK
jgi:hypothetical protein